MIQGLKKVVESVKAIVGIPKIGPIDERIADSIRTGFNGIDAGRLPVGIVGFPEADVAAEV